MYRLQRRTEGPHVQRQENFTPGQLELQLRRDRRVTRRPGEPTWSIEVKLIAEPDGLTCQVRAALRRPEPPARFYLEGRYTLVSADELAARITSLNGATTDLQTGHERQLPETLSGGGPVEHYRLWSEADERDSPRIDITFHPIQLVLDH